MIDKVIKEVSIILGNDKSGHDIDHIKRVVDLALRFSNAEEANKEVITLIALLHDVDDYKLFGLNNAKNLTNTKRILNKCCVDKKIQKVVLEEVSNIGYSKRLKGLCPKTIEGKIVSDADMCDVIGANGILRICAYSIKVGRPFFDKSKFPIENITSATYSLGSDSGVNHIFEKILKLKDLMFTDIGKIEIQKREKIVIEFLYQLFEEEHAYDWIEYLNRYLENNTEIKLVPEKNI